MNLFFVLFSEVSSDVDGSTCVELTACDPRFVHIFEVLNSSACDMVKLGVVDGPSGTAKIEWIPYRTEDVLAMQLGDGYDKESHTPVSLTSLVKFRLESKKAGGKTSRALAPLPLRISTSSASHDESRPDELFAIDGHQLLGGNINALQVSESDTVAGSESRDEQNAELGLHIESASTVTIKKAGAYYGRRHNFDWDQTFSTGPDSLGASKKLFGRFIKGVRLYLQFNPSLSQPLQSLAIDNADGKVLVDIDILLACPRPKVVDRVMASLATFGVRRVHVFQADKVDQCYFNGKQLSPEHINENLMDGLSQGAYYTRLPKVSVHPRTPLQTLLSQQKEDVDTSVIKIVAHPGTSLKVRDILSSSSFFKDAKKKKLDIVLAIGPEGGWTSPEVRCLEDSGFEKVCLGPRILKTHDATVNLLGLVYDALE